jgi:hypothetical protein
MEFDKTELKKKLLEMAKQESLKFGQDLNKEMENKIGLEKSESEKWVKIIYLDENIKREPIDQTSFEQLLEQLSPSGAPIQFEIIENENYVQFQFQEEDIVNRVYDYYHDFFFGTLQQEMLNEYLEKYISELMDEGCATGSCGASQSESCSTCDHPEDEDTSSE